MKMPPWKKITLKEAIGDAFPEFGDLRNLCAQALARRLNQCTSEHATHYIAVSELVENAEQRGQLGDLIRVAAEKCPNDPELAELAWQWRLLTDLDDRLTKQANQRTSEVARCYDVARPNGWPTRIGKESESLMNYAWDLVDAPIEQSDARVPLLIFVQGLKELFSDRRQSLEEWECGAIRCFAEQEGMSEDQLRLRLESSRRAPNRGDKAPWVTILVRPDGKEPKPYTVKGWLYSPDYPAGKELLEEREETFPMAEESELPERFSELLENANRWYAGDETIHVEVFLTDELRHRAIDQWDKRPAMAGDNFRFPFGYHHPMVIRCLKRVSNASALNATIRRWRSISGGNGCPSIVEHASDSPNAAYWVAQIPLTRDQFCELDRSKGIGCVLIGSPICSEVEPRTVPEIDAILEIGVPIVIWVRRPPDTDPSRLRGSLTDLVRKGSLRDLYDVVWKKRRDEYQDQQPPEHLCRNISILYDNPDRLPSELDPRRRMHGPIGRIAR
jgi:vWA-MoxR associated protein C-terminal domain/Effector-associated domain 1